MMAINMICKNILLFVATLSFISAVNSQDSDGNLKADTLDVLPGGSVLDQSITLNDVTCKFTYAAVGGTNEQWLFSLKHSEDKTLYTCTVERPEGSSYLYFMQFNLQLEGAAVDSAFAERSQGVALKEEEYILNKEVSSVTHVEGKFESQLVKVEITGKKPHEEL